jgi:hypothetical protein
MPSGITKFVQKNAISQENRYCLYKSPCRMGFFWLVQIRTNLLSGDVAFLPSGLAD